MSRAAMGDEQAARSMIGRLRHLNAHWPILAARFLFPAETGSLRTDARYDRMLRHIDRAWGLVE